MNFSFYEFILSYIFLRCSTKDYLENESSSNRFQNTGQFMGSYRWSTESVARDRLFLKYLGIGAE